MLVNLPLLAASLCFLPFASKLSASLTLLLVFVPLAALYIFAASWSTVATVYVLSSPEAPTWRAALRRSLPDAAPFLATSLLAGILTFLGVILLIVPGIIIGIWFAFWPYVFVAEGVRGRAGLRRSRELVRGRWWGVAWRFALPFVFYMIVSGLLTVPIQYVFGQGVSSVTSYLIGYVLSPLLLAIVYVLYRAVAATPVAARTQ